MHSLPTSAASQDQRANRLLSALVGCLFLLSILALWVAPRLDLAVDQQYFYRAGSGFFYAHLPWVELVYRHTWGVGYGVLALCALVIIAKRWIFKSIPVFYQRTAIAMLLTALLSSGIVIPHLLKPAWSRPRPVQVIELGGHEPYQSPLQPCGWCNTGNSFVSGHAAAGFTLLGLGLLASAKWRRRWLLLGLLTGGFVGWVRLAQGGHFLSDVVFAFFAVWFSGELVRYVMLKAILPQHANRERESS